MKGKVLYFTVMPSPFQLEFIDYINSNSAWYEYVPIFMYDIKDYRSTWRSAEGCNRIVLNDGSRVGFYKKLFTIIKETSPDRIILTQYNSLYTLAIILYSIKHDIDFYFGPIENMRNGNYFLDALKKKYFTFVTRRAKALFVIGSRAVKFYKKIYNGPVMNVPYTFDLSNLSQPRNNNKAITFLYSGRLVPFRNPLLAIECFSEVEKIHKNIRLILSGKGELKGECDKLIKDLNLTQKIKWRNDFTDWNDIHKNLYCQADVLLALQKWSTWGLIIQEAMAAGLGVIATNTMDSANELIIDEYNGFIVSLDKDQIVYKMKQYIENQDLLNLHSDRSRDVSKVMDIKNVGSRFIAFFEKINKVQ
jgi:poly(glycerol-phosphate) alpha-glucosyltransferase